MQVKFKTLENEEMELESDIKTKFIDLFNELKEKYSDKFNGEFEKFKFIYSGKIFGENDTLESCGFDSSSNKSIVLYYKHKKINESDKENETKKIKEEQIEKITQNIESSLPSIKMFYSILSTELKRNIKGFFVYLYNNFIKDTSNTSIQRLIEKIKEEFKDDEELIDCNIFYILTKFENNIEQIKFIYDNLMFNIKKDIYNAFMLVNDLYFKNIQNEVFRNFIEKIKNVFDAEEIDNESENNNEIDNEAEDEAENETYTETGIEIHTESENTNISNVINIALTQDDMDNINTIANITSGSFEDSIQAYMLYNRNIEEAINLMFNDT